MKAANSSQNALSLHSKQSSFTCTKDREIAKEQSRREGGERSNHVLNQNPREEQPMSNLSLDSLSLSLLFHHHDTCQEGGRRWTHWTYPGLQCAHQNTVSLQSARCYGLNVVWRKVALLFGGRPCVKVPEGNTGQLPLEGNFILQILVL